MQYIRDELGYDEKLSDYDGLPKYHGNNRHDTMVVLIIIVFGMS